MLLIDFFKKYLIFAQPGSVVRRISWLTIFGLAFSLFSFILVMSVMTALNIHQKNRTLAAEAHLIIESLEQNTVLKTQNHPIYNKLKSLPDVEVYPYEIQDVILRTMDGKFRGAIARGMDWESIQKMIKRIKDQAHFSKKITEIEKPLSGEVLIGIDLAQSLGVFEGDSLMVVPPEGLLLPPSEAPKYEKVRVAQIISTNIGDLDAQMMFYVSGETLQALSQTASHQTGIEVRIPSPDDVEQFVEENLSLFSGVKIETWKERNSALFFALKLEKFMIGLFLAMASLVAGLSLVSVMSLLISQKRKEIALLQTLGFSQGKIRELFSRLGLVLAAVGILSGIILGSIVSFYLELHPLNILPDIYYDSEIPAKFQPLQTMFVLLVACGLAYLGSYWTSKNVAEKSISALLREKT